MRTVIGVLLLVAVIPTGTAGVYKCRDADGRLHYQDRPCASGKKPAAFNESAGNVTSFDSATASGEAQAFLDNAERERATQAARRDALADDAISRSSYQAQRDRLDSQINRTAPTGIQRPGEFKSRGESEAQRLSRERRNLDGMENARINGTTFTPESAPSPPPLPPAIIHKRHDNGVVFDQYGTPYTQTGAGGPLINQQTGKFCQRTGGPNIQCE